MQEDNESVRDDWAEDDALSYETKMKVRIIDHYPRTVSIWLVCRSLESSCWWTGCWGSPLLGARSWTRKSCSCWIISWPMTAISKQKAKFRKSLKSMDGVRNIPCCVNSTGRVLVPGWGWPQRKGSWSWPSARPTGTRSPFPCSSGLHSLSRFVVELWLHFVLGFEGLIFDCTTFFLSGYLWGGEREVYGQAEQRFAADAATDVLSLHHGVRWYRA